MSKPPISTEHLSETLHMSQCHDGFWLYDDTRGMNLGMREKSEKDALVAALMYYQDRLTRVESEHKELYKVVEGFVIQLRGVNDDEFGLIVEDI